MRRRHFLGSVFSSIAVAAVWRGTPVMAMGGGSSDITAIGNALRFPSTWNGTSTLTPAFINRQIWPGINTKVISTGGYPGATIDLRSGQNLSVEIHNMMQSATSIHWHGLDVPSAMDGHPKDQIAPNVAKRYTFDITNRASLYFYHSHAHMATATQVYNGLFGLFRVRDEEEDALALPSGEYEVPLVIQDVQIDAQSQLLYTPAMIDQMEGYLSNKILTNGTPEAYLQVKKGWYRFRLVNASNARIYHIGFSDNRTFHVIGSDGGLLSSAATTQTIPLAPGERYDLLVDLSDLATGSNIRIVSRQYTPPIGQMGSPTYPPGLPFDILRLDAVDGQGMTYNIPATLSAIERYIPGEATRTRVFELAMQMIMGMGMNHTINGKLFEMDRIDERVPRGSLEIWELVNKDDDMTHPMHIHGGQFQILSRNGSTDIPAWERGWKDTFLIHPDERVQIGVRFDTYTGLFLLHCHNLEHEDDGMMMNYEVTAPTDVSEQDGNAISAWYAPSQDAIVVRGMTATAVHMMLYDNSGKVMFDRTSDLLGGEITIPAVALASGGYTLRIDAHTHRIAVVR